MNSGDTPLFKKSRTLYGMYRAKDKIAKERKAILTEGYLDVIACHKAGLTNAVASLGTALTEDHAKMLKRWCEEVIILYDSDAAGQKAAERAVEILQIAEVRARVVLLPQGEDPDTMVRSGSPASLLQAVQNTLSPTSYRIELLRRQMPMSDERFWPEAMMIIANSPTRREAERQIVLLSAFHPDFKDPLVAQGSMLKEVWELRGGRDWTVRPGGGRKPVSTSKQAPENRPSSSESVLFLAFLSEEFRPQAFATLRERDLFETKTGAEAATALTQAFSEPPTGPAASWLHNLPAETVTILADVEFSSNLTRLNREFVAETIENLRKIREKRELRFAKGQPMDEKGKQDYLDRLKKLKQGSVQ